jgi:hypothetical protein
VGCHVASGSVVARKQKAALCSTHVHASSWRNEAACGFDQRRGQALQPAAAVINLVCVAALLGSHGPVTETTQVVTYSN